MTAETDTLVKGFLQCLTFDRSQNVEHINLEQWAALQALCRTLQEPFPSEVARLRNEYQTSAWLYRIEILIGWTNTRRLACDVTERVLHVFEKRFPDDKRPHEAIRLARRYADLEAAGDAVDPGTLKGALGEMGRTCEAAMDAARAAFGPPYHDYPGAFAAEAASLAAASPVFRTKRSLQKSEQTMMRSMLLFPPSKFAEENDWRIGRICAYARGEAP